MVSSCIVGQSAVNLRAFRCEILSDVIMATRKRITSCWALFGVLYILEIARDYKIQMPASQLNLQK